MADLRPPRKTKLFRESRAVLEIAYFLFKFPRLPKQPCGIGKTVITIPGFMASDISFYFLRKYLHQLGYKALGWGMGRNFDKAEKLLPRIIDLIIRESSQNSHLLFLIGWSYGGFLAREAAREVPEMVDKIITLGSPVVGGPKYTVVAGMFKKRGYDLDTIEQEIEARNEIPLNIPVAAIYTKKDGIVAWQACIDEHNPNVEHIEVKTTHIGLCYSAEVFEIITEQLAAVN